MGFVGTVSAWSQKSGEQDPAKGCVNHSSQEYPTGYPRAGKEKCVTSTVWLRALLEVPLADCAHCGVHSAGSIASASQRPASNISVHQSLIFLLFSFPPLPRGVL